MSPQTETPGFVPRLETERLVLDAHCPADLEPLASLWSDPRIAAAIGINPSTRHESWSRLLRYRGLWPLLGFGYWAVREKPSLRYIGDIGFADFHREYARSIEGLPEAGWAFLPSTHANGLGTEALRAALGWLDTKPALGPAVCLIDQGNTVSIRLAKRNGFRDPVLLPDTAGLFLLTRDPRDGASDAKQERPSF
jgi:RimJ/RimL family protein N-acetyltransferase